MTCQKRTMIHDTKGEARAAIRRWRKRARAFVQAGHLSRMPRYTVRKLDNGRHLVTMWVNCGRR